ncbi:hypothetical protein FACS1894132_09940 [Clostridia bacterium]|nr:hypothetical protein FACS1894132_09940 [Clostridia bacterium]
MVQSKKIINLLTICRKAGKAVFGFDPCVGANCELLLVTTDISPKTLKDLKYKCPDTEILEIDLTKQDLSEVFHKQIAIVGICDEGFSVGIKQVISNSE